MATIKKNQGQRCLSIDTENGGVSKKIVLKVNPTLELSACGWYVFELGGPSSGAFNGDDGKNMNVESGDTVDTFRYLVATLTQWVTIDHTTFLTEISPSGVVD